MVVFRWRGPDLVTLYYVPKRLGLRLQLWNYSKTPAMINLLRTPTQPERANIHT